MKKNLPNFIIVGVMKGSTSAAAINLNKHQDVYCVTPYWKKKVNTYYNINPSLLSKGLGEINSKELDFFNDESNYNLGIEFYKQYFPRSLKIQGEASPNYFCANETLNNVVIDRMYTHLPNAKIIIILRDPITRAYSHWNHIQSPNSTFGERFKNKTFNECTSQIQYLYGNKNQILRRSKYLSNIKKFRFAFGADNVYVTTQEAIKASSLEEYNKIYRFLEVPTLDSDPGYKKVHSREYHSTIDDASLTFLKTYFKSDVDGVKALYPDLDYSHWNAY